MDSSRSSKDGTGRPPLELGRPLLKSYSLWYPAQQGTWRSHHFIRVAHPLRRNTAIFSSCNSGQAWRKITRLNKSIPTICFLALFPLARYCSKHSLNWQIVNTETSTCSPAAALLSCSWQNQVSYPLPPWYGWGVLQRAWLSCLDRPRCAQACAQRSIGSVTPGPGMVITYRHQGWQQGQR